MSTSPARLAANQANSAKSTGPKTLEGKARSRANSLKHGLTGNGIVLPTDDVGRMEEVARELHDKYQPTTDQGSFLLDRAALHTVRLDRMGRHELALVDDRVRAAVYDFDQARRDHADELFDGLSENPGATRQLLSFPEGIDRMIEEWASLDSVEEWNQEEFDRAVRLSGEPGLDPKVLRGLVPAEIGGLEILREGIDRRPIELARNRAADLALFDTSPEAILARKYEAATERSLHKSMKEFHLAEGTEPKAPLGSILPEKPAEVAEPTVALASSSPDTPAPPIEPDPVPPNPPVDRVRRPDPRKLLDAQRRKSG